MKGKIMHILAMIFAAVVVFYLFFAIALVINMTRNPEGSTKHFGLKAHMKMPIHTLIK